MRKLDYAVFLPIYTIGWLGKNDDGFSALFNTIIIFRHDTILSGKNTVPVTSLLLIFDFSFSHFPQSIGLFTYSPQVSNNSTIKLRTILKLYFGLKRLIM